MIRLKSRISCPPGGFQFTERDGWESRRVAPDTLWSFKSLCAQIRRHRLDHPALNLTTDISAIETEVDYDNAVRVSSLPSGHVFVVYDPVLAWAGDINAPLPPMPAMHREPFSGPGISAIVPIHQPPAGRLNKCLSALLPQVDEI